MTGPDSLGEAFLAQYKLAVEMPDRVSARRAIASGFFFTVQSALITAFGFAKHDRWPLAVAGIVVAAAWWLSLRSYRMLNGAKFEVINKMEEGLPAAPFKDEWTKLDRKDGLLHKRYAALSFVEQAVPFAFVAVSVGPATCNNFVSGANSAGTVPPTPDAARVGDEFVLPRAGKVAARSTIDDLGLALLRLRGRGEQLRRAASKSGVTVTQYVPDIRVKISALAQADTRPSGL